MARLVKVIVIALSSFVASTALAQSIDPTAPPASWLRSGDAGSVGAEEIAVLRLQSVLIPQRGRPVAVIGGKTIILGDRVGAMTLIHLNEREAILQGPDGMTRLYLTPDVEKRMIEIPQSHKTGKSGNMKGLP